HAIYVLLGHFVLGLSEPLIDRSYDVGPLKGEFAFDNHSVHDREDSGTTVVVALDGLVIFEQSADLGRLRQHAARNIGGDKGVDLALLQHLAEVGSIHDAEVDAHKAIALAPDLSGGHLALASVYKSLLDIGRAYEEYDRALKLDPGNTRILRRY